MSEALPDASLRRVCRILAVPRSNVYQRVTNAAAPPVRSAEPAATETSDAQLIERIRELINAFPTYGYRRITALLQQRKHLSVNRKRVYRIMRQQRWMVTQRMKGPKPRVRRSRSQTEQSNTRWAMDITHVPCGADGWAHLTAVIDCHDREVVGWEFSQRGRAKEAERALESACLARFGTLRPTATPR